MFLLKQFFLKKSWISPARLHFHLFSVFVLSRRHCILIRGGGKYLFFHHCVSLISFDIIIIIIEYTWILNFLLNRNEIRAKYKIFGRRREGMKLWKLIDSASIYLKVQCKYVKHNGNTNIKHGKKNIKYRSFSIIHYRDINLNYFRKRRRFSKLFPFSKGWNSISNFVPLSPSILHADTRNFIIPIIKLQINTHNPPCRLVARVTKHPLRTMTGEILNPTKAFPRRAKLYRVFRYSPQLKH